MFALTQITALTADEPTGWGKPLIAVVWWCWVGCSWLSNVVKADEGACSRHHPDRDGAMFLVALAIPESFTDFACGHGASPGGLDPSPTRRHHRSLR